MADLKLVKGASTNYCLLMLRELCQSSVISDGGADGAGYLFGEKDSGKMQAI